MSAITTNAKSSGNRADSTAVPPGFRQTEMGLIPSDWTIKQLADVCKSQGIIRGPFGGTLKKDIFVTTGFKVYEQRNAIYKSCDIGSYFITQGKYADMHRFSVSPGDFIVSCSGTIGCIYQIPPDAPQGVINQALLKLMTNESIIHDRYFYILFEWDRFQARITDSTQGGAMKNLVGMNVFRTTPIVLPPSSEQFAIAEALSDVDGLIEAMENLIAKKRAIKQAAMQQLLTGKTRLPGFSGKWGNVRLRDLLSYERPDRYIVRDTEYSERGDIPVLTANKSFILGYTIEDFGICRDLPAIVFDDFTTDSKYVNFPFKVKSSAIKLLRPKHDHVDLRFVFDRMQLIHFPLGNHKRYYISEYQNLELAAPDHEERQAIATVLSDMDAEIDVLEQRLSKTRAIKQGMMQQLLTGRVRLVKPQAPAVQAKAGSKGAKAHSWAFNEAVVISTLAKQFGSEQFPLGRKRYTKLSYLLHRHAEKQAEGYLKKVAGPYNPRTKYGGPERIAVESGYIHEHKRGPYRGFVAADNIAKAEGYFEKWYGPECTEWLEQFRRKRNDDLELLATVDMVAEELRVAQKDVDVDGVKAVIRSHPGWKAKLGRSVFSDANIAKAIETCETLFD